MKKTLAFITIILTLLLTSCSESSSVGIIGGADGPTAVMVAGAADFPFTAVIAAAAVILLVAIVTIVLWLVNKK